MLTAYLTNTRNVLQLPGTNSTSLYSDANLTTFVNIARGQLAGEAKCIRALGSISTAIGTQQYNFSGITGLGTGIQGALNVRSVRCTLGDGSKWITPRPWAWFELYQLGNIEPVAGIPVEWSQFGQGAPPAPTTPPASGTGSGGSFFVGPPPDAVYPLICDCTCYPIALVDDTTAEAIPYLFTDAVPWLAAYYALMSAQTNARMNDALNYYKIYEEWVDRARKAANPSVLRWQYEDAQDPAQAAKFGIKPGASAA